jgi:Tfp pilus assembly PilM family ATPase
LDAETTRFHLLSATVKGGQVRLEQSAVWDEDQALTPSTAGSAGQRLRDQLRQEGIAPAPLLVCIGRDRVIVKELKIPNVPPHEQPGIVRFQAMKEFSESGEDAVLDFIPAGETAAGELRVQVVSVKKELLTTFRTLAEAAGLTLAAVTPRAFALVAGLRQAIAQRQVQGPEPPDAAVAILVRGERWGEFTVTREGSIQQARSLAGPALSSQSTLVSEVRRNLAIHANHNPSRPVTAIYLAEPDSPGGLREHLEAALGLPVYAYEPVVGVQVPDGPLGGLTGAAGLLALRADGSELPINFAQPRQPRPPRDPGKRLLLIGGIAAAGVALFFGLFAYLHVSSKNREVARMQKQKDQLEDTVRMLDPEFKRLKALDDWNASDIIWLDELYDMTAHMTDINRLHVVSLSAAAPTQADTGRPTQTKTPASMGLKIISAEDHVPIDRLRNELSMEPAFRFPGLAPKRNTGVERQRFPREYDGQVLLLEKRTPDKYTRTFTATAPPRNRGDDSGDFQGMMGGGVGP